MTKKIDDLVEYVGGENPRMAHIKAALARIAEFPEVLDKIEEGNRLHGRKLRIGIINHDWGWVYAPSLHGIGVGTASGFSVDSDGNTYKRSVEASLAHEIEHARQEDFDESAAQTFEARCLGIISDVMKSEAASAVFQRYEARIRAAGDDEAKLRKIADEIYDKQLPPILAEAFRKDDYIGEHIKKYEIPAIRFENAIAEKLGEPTRLLDYISSSPTWSGKEDFVSAIANYARTRCAAIESKDPSEIRPDAPPKNEPKPGRA